MSQTQERRGGERGVRRRLPGAWEEGGDRRAGQASDRRDRPAGQPTGTGPDKQHLMDIVNAKLQR
jgi:hypothetical protein